MKRIFAVAFVGVAVIALAAQYAAAAAWVYEPFSGYTEGPLGPYVTGWDENSNPIMAAGQTATGTGLTGEWSGSGSSYQSIWNFQSTGLTPGSAGSIVLQDGLNVSGRCGVSASTTGAVTTATQSASSFYFSFEAYRDASNWEQNWMTQYWEWKSSKSGAVFTLKNGNNTLTIGVEGDDTPTPPLPPFGPVGTGHYYAQQTYWVGDFMTGHLVANSGTGGTYTNNTTTMIVGKYTRVAGSNNDIFSLFAVDAANPGTAEPTALITMNAADIFGSGTGINTILLGTENFQGANAGHTATTDEYRVAATWADVTGQTVITYLAGDADKNGTVNGADLNTVLSNYNQVYTGDAWGYGDFDANGTVNGADLNTVLSNYNQVSSATAAVPEPATLLLAAIGLIGLLCYGWRKRK